MEVHYPLLLESCFGYGYQVGPSSPFLQSGSRCRVACAHRSWEFNSLHLVLPYFGLSAWMHFETPYFWTKSNASWSCTFWTHAYSVLDRIWDLNWIWLTQERDMFIGLDFWTRLNPIWTARLDLGTDTLLDLWQVLFNSFYTYLSTHVY